MTTYLTPDQLDSFNRVRCYGRPVRSYVSIDGTLRCAHCSREIDYSYTIADYRHKYGSESSKGQLRNDYRRMIAT